MRKKILWVLLSCLMVAALVLASCAPAAVEEEGERVIGKVVEKEEKVVKEKEVVAPEEKGPQYGGTLTVLPVHGGDPGSWDPYDCNWIIMPYTSPYLEQPMIGDFEKYGPRGTNEFAFTDMEFIPPKFRKGCLAESWEVPDPTTIVYHVRKGIYFPDKPGLMASREMTADDWVFCYNRLLESPKAAGYYVAFDTPGAVTALDKYTVEIKMKYYDGWWDMILGWGYFPKIYPREVVDADIHDWRNAVGTGPFMLADYVSGASLNWVKNPVYWAKTTIDGKEYKIPFVDRLIWPIIPDESTRLAALRTGKCDFAESVSWKYKESLEESNPELARYRRLATGAGVLAMRMDTPPFDDYRVRKALSMAIDRQSIIDSLLGGEAEMLSFPFSKGWGEEYYTPLEEFPEATQELFEYNPEKAKQLMAEAGYPAGFKSEVVFWAPYGDTMSLVADYLSKMDVELELKPIESYISSYVIMRGKEHKQMFYFGKGCGDPIQVLFVMGHDPDQFWNTSIWDDAYFRENIDKARGTIDPAEAAPLLKHLNAYIIEQAPFLIMPVGYAYAYAWPWVKNWYGEVNVNCRSPGQIHARVWLDLEMKKKMGY